MNQNQSIEMTNDQGKNSHDEMIAIQLDRVVDKKFPLDHPEVIDWTNYFYKNATVPQIFQPIHNNPLYGTIHSTNIVGSMWSIFSEFMPKFLCLAAAKVRNNEIRHYIVQVAFEELGSRNVDHLHSKMFDECLRMAGCTKEAQEIFNSNFKNIVPLQLLWDELEKTNSTETILGIGLGLEIPAVENIETIFHSLAHNEESKEKLQKSLFFRIHRVNEEEHIRLNVANFLRFCPEKRQKEDFIKGFNLAISFWKIFWGNADQLIQSKKGQAQ